MPGKLKLATLRPADRSIVEQGIQARKAGKKKEDNPHRKGKPKVAHNASMLWWDLGYEGAYE